AVLDTGVRVRAFAGQRIADTVATGGIVRESEASAPRAILGAVIKNVALSRLGVADAIAAAMDRLADIPYPVMVFVRFAWVKGGGTIVDRIGNAIPVRVLGWMRVAGTTTRQTPKYQR